MIRTKEVVVGVQATFNMGNYQSIKVSRHETLEITEDDAITSSIENELRNKIVEAVKEDARFYACELFKQDVK